MMGGRLTSDPNRSSLGLLPSGPDPVGEWLVHRQPPGLYIGGTERECKRRTSVVVQKFPLFRRESIKGISEPNHTRSNTLLGVAWLYVGHESRVQNPGDAPMDGLAVAF